MISLGVRAEAAVQLRAYAALLPLGLRELDGALAAEAAENPWLELLDRPLLGLGESEATLAVKPSLGEHLELQLAASGIAGASLRAARYVVGALDEHAYLRDDVATIARLAHVGEAAAAKAVELVQRLLPTGVAARSLGERFRLQLGEEGEARSLSFDLTFELDALATEGASAFAAARGLPPAALSSALQRLRACDPYPARDFLRPLDRAFPEIVIAREGDVLRASIDGRYWPAVRLATLDASELSEPMRRARSRARLVVDALARRKTTLERVAIALLERQEKYFSSGGDARDLVPLSGRELARDLGCAESTISRALADRYAQTPFGTKPLRAFLVRRPGGIDMTAAAVREHVRALAEASPASSDETLTRSLRLRGVRLARRTVAKYRSDLGLGSSRTRARP